MLNVGASKEGPMLVLPPQQKHRRSIVAPILTWCHDRLTGILRPLERARIRPDGCVIPDSGAAGDVPGLARYCYDASLLFRRMAVVRIDRDLLASDDPLLFRELQGLCTLCQSKERCVQDFAQECDDAGRQDWHEYCPNAPTLNAVGAVQNCSRAARHLKTPHSTGYLASR
jgi:hypothetical protein